jgi:hypothetical protein
VSRLIASIDADCVEEAAKVMAGGAEPDDNHRNLARDKLVGQAATVFNGPLIELIDSIRRDKEQTIDHDTLPALRSIPIIAVTSYALSGEEKKARAAGCDDYVPKPFSPRELLAKIRQYLPE